MLHKVRFPIPISCLDITTHTHLYVEGYYLYEWRDGIRPFYVGMGRARRAWNQHLPPPEERRAVAKDFRIVILSHQLTKPIAHNLERYHIANLLRQGHNLVNTRIPRKL